MIYQRTLKRMASATGVGLHSGAKVSISLHPAPAGTGVLFRRTDMGLSDSKLRDVSVAATVENVTDTNFATSLCQGGVKVSTVEHLMAAFAGLGIDNVVVETDAPELPVMDGSAAPFVTLIQSAGTRVLSMPKKVIRILQKVQVADASASACLMPYDGFCMEYQLEYDHPVFRNHPKFARVEFSGMTFENTLAKARTFGFLADIEQLRSMDLARGACLDNTVVVDDSRILNESGLRYPDEFVKHKMLDALGDLYLLGHNIVGKFKGYKSGHRMNNLLLNKLLQEPDTWELVTLGETVTASSLSSAFA
ncbi:MAG: UDP-3-O-acyl-N-acetylglucosamine deacetylase [Pseudomonadales bacterium]|nr:UDP-3-O-acyl-N-acetylglucosamine deacetylase [Pseudomonadales bacterium]